MRGTPWFVDDYLDDVTDALEYGFEGLVVCIGTGGVVPLAIEVVQLQTLGFDEAMLQLQ